MRTTIYLDEKLKLALLSISSEESKKLKKRVGMAEIIKKALREYLSKKGFAVETKDSVINTMLSTKGTLDSRFEKRVDEVKANLNKLKL